MAICDLLGQWDYKRGTYDSIIEIQRKSNRYDRTLAKGIQYLISKYDDPEAKELHQELEQWTFSMEGEI